MISRLVAFQKELDRKRVNILGLGEGRYVVSHRSEHKPHLQGCLQGRQGDEVRKGMLPVLLR